MGLLDGRRALVTGAATRIGRASAARLAAEGRVLAVDRDEGPDLGESALPLYWDLLDTGALTVQVLRVDGGLMVAF